MARLFIRQQPVDCEVEVGMGIYTFYLPKNSLQGYEIYPNAPNNLSARHVHIIHEGNCYDVTTIVSMGNKQIRLGCVLREKDTLSDMLVMTDMIID